MLNADQKLQLSSAGFTDREITLHRQKFYNLFNTAPIDFTRNMIGYRAQRNELLVTCRGLLKFIKSNTPFGADDALKEIEEAIIRCGINEAHDEDVIL